MNSFARVSVVVGIDVADYWQNGKRRWLRLREKGGKHHEQPAHHNAEAYLDAQPSGGGSRDRWHPPAAQVAAVPNGRRHQRSANGPADEPQ